MYRLFLFLFLLATPIGLAAQNKAPYINTNFQRGTHLRVLRLAMSAAGEYTQKMKGSTNEEKVEEVLKQFKRTIATINLLYGRELCVRLELLPDNLERKLIFADPNTDPWPFMSGSGCDGAGKIHSIQFKAINDIVGAGNYDISHVIIGDYNGGCGGWFYGGYSGGLNDEGSVTDHEMGHQFNASHSCKAEPMGVGKTIMCCDCEPYFHADSYQAAAETLLKGQKNAGSDIPTGNHIPSINAGLDKTIPIGTPFTLKGAAQDPDAGDVLTYVWDEMDWEDEKTKKPLPHVNDVVGPLFCRYIPTVSQKRTFPNVDSIIENKLANTFEQLPRHPRELNFRLTVNDNHKFMYNGEWVNASGINSDDIKITVVDNGGPFRVTSPNDSKTYQGGDNMTITWNVGGTDKIPIGVQNVEISLSCDGGKSFKVTLLKSTPNIGQAVVTLPNIDSRLCRVKIAAIDNYFFAINTKDFYIKQNVSKPAIVIKATSPGLLVSETGYTSKYALGLSTNPSSPVKICLTTENQAEVSSDGKTFFTKLFVTLNNTTPITITIRGKYDNIIEGMHSDVIEHSVYASGDINNYPQEMVGTPLTVRVADAQVPPIAGVAFNSSTKALPTNWIKVSDLRNQLIKNLSLDDGEQTSINLDIKATDCGVGGCSFECAVYGPTPRHIQSLDALSGAAIARGMVTFTFSGLQANTKYRFFLFGYNPFGILQQKVTISGGGQPISFYQKANQVCLVINDKPTTGPGKMGSVLLANFAKQVVSTAEGTLKVEVTSILGQDEIGLAGLGFCK